MKYIKLPHFIYELMPDMSQAELKVTICLLRHTVGFHRDTCKLTYEDFVNETGLSRRSVRTGIQEVVNRGLFIQANGQSNYIKNSANFALLGSENSAKSKLSDSKIVQKVNYNSANFAPNTGLPKDNTKDKEEEKDNTPLAELCRHFAQQANLNNREWNEPKWYLPIIEIYKACGNDFNKTNQTITDAIQDMRDADLTIATPYSIQTTAVKIATATGKSKSVALAEWERVKEQARIGKFSLEGHTLRVVREIGAVNLKAMSNGQEGVYRKRFIKLYKELA